MPLIPIEYPLPPAYEIEPGLADKVGLAIALNDLFDREPQRFGTKEQRQTLCQFVRQHMHGLETLNDQTFYQALNQEIRRMEIGNPLEGIAIAFVGGYHFHYGDASSTTIDAFPILYGHPCHVDAFYDIAEATMGGARLTTANAPQIAKAGKVDYLITGNVINSPSNPDNDDAILACASLVKKGGHVIHMLNYGEDATTGHIDHPALITLAGQTHLWNQPPGPYRRYDTDIMMLKQEHEVTHTPETLAAYRESRATGKPLPQFHTVDVDLTPSAHSLQSMARED